LTGKDDKNSASRNSFLQVGQPVNTGLLVRRMPSFPFRSRLVELKLKRGIGWAEVLLRIG
jgi:hypothetical protein